MYTRDIIELHSYINISSTSVYVCAYSFVRFYEELYSSTLDFCSSLILHGDDFAVAFVTREYGKYSIQFMQENPFPLVGGSDISGVTRHVSSSSRVNDAPS